MGRLGLQRLWGGAGLGFIWWVAHTAHGPFKEVPNSTGVTAPTYYYVGPPSPM